MTTQARAAQYLRVSTEHQKYSFENQAAAISMYAAARSLSIIRTYADTGRSGLTLRGREGLQRLLSDALSIGRDFSAILVFDVSRWGRFQDTDQAAHYEFICRQAGAQVHYCAEAFENDGSSAATILKHVKRVMAAEFSAELGRKVHAGQVTGARHGFKQGGAAPFALRRLLRDEHGTPMRVLQSGQRKSVQTDRVVLVWGSQREIEAVRNIFRWFTREGLTFKAIAARLRSEGDLTESAYSVGPAQVGRILRNEIYAGTYTYNRTCQRLRASVRRRPKEEWVTVPMLEGVVSRREFAAAQRRLRMRCRHPAYSDQELLSHLRRVAESVPRFTSRDLERVTGPCPATYYNRFGGIERALELSGWSGAWRRRSRTESVRTGTVAIAEGLRRLLRANGHLSSDLINQDPGLPSASVVRRRFGTLWGAYRAAGWNVTASELRINANRRRWKRSTCRQEGK